MRWARYNTNPGKIGGTRPPLSTVNLHSDPTAPIEFHRPDDRFIPLSPNDLVAALLAGDLAQSEPNRLPDLTESLRHVIEQEASALEWHLVEGYSPYNPDRDTILLREHRPPAAADIERMHQDLRYVLGKANFEELAWVQLEAVMRLARLHRLRVRLRPERIQSLSIWVRGRGSVRTTRHSFFRPWRSETQVTEVFRRLVVVAHLKDDPNIHVKIFKEIPLHEIEILLPHAEATMTWYDQFALWGGGSLAIGTTATKIMGLLTAVTAFTQLAWALLVGGGLLTYRTIVGYRTARLRRDSLRTRHLYFQNLSNNVGAIHYLVGLIAQEELKEALLAYAACLRGTPPRDALELRYRVESFLQQQLGIRAHFDVLDAVETLERLRLWQDRAQWRVVPPSRAIERLQEHWASRLTRDYHVHRCRAAEPAASAPR